MNNELKSLWCMVSGKEKDPIPCQNIYIYIYMRFIWAWDKTISRDTVCVWTTMYDLQLWVRKLIEPNTDAIDKKLQCTAFELKLQKNWMSWNGNRKWENARRVKRVYALCRTSVVVTKTFKLNAEFTSEAKKMAESQTHTLSLRTHRTQKPTHSQKNNKKIYIF